MKITTFAIECVALIVAGSVPIAWAGILPGAVGRIAVDDFSAARSRSASQNSRGFIAKAGGWSRFPLGQATVLAGAVEESFVFFPSRWPRTGERWSMGARGREAGLTFCSQT